MSCDQTERQRSIQDAYNKDMELHRLKAVKKSVRAVIEATRAAEPEMETYKSPKAHGTDKKRIKDYVKKLEKENAVGGCRSAVYI